MRRKVVSTSKVTRKFQVTLRKPVRDKLNVDVGDLVVFYEENGVIIVEKV